MKKALAILLSVLLLVAAVPLGAVSVAAESTSGTTGDCTWVVDANGHLTISGHGAMRDGLGLYHYPWSNTITSVTIEDGVTNIGNYVFSKCFALTSITIPDSVTSIGDYAFYECTALTSINFPKHLTYIGHNAFMECDGLTSVTIPDSVTEIGWYSFRNCSKLKSVTIGNGLTEIAPYAFSVCIQLESVDLGELLQIIDVEAFYFCTKLTSITFPESLISIEGGAFKSCISLASIYLPKHVCFIGSGAFALCQALKTIEVVDENTYFCAVDNVLFDKQMTTLFQYPLGQIQDVYAVPDGVTYIENGAFDACVQVPIIYLPASLEGIGTSAFNDSLYDDKDALLYLLYGGSFADWQDVYIGEKNDRLGNSTKIFNACYPDEHTYTADCDNLCNNCKWERVHPIASHTNNDTDIVHCDVCFSDLLLYTVVNGGAVITDFLSTPPKQLEIPPTIDGYPVTGIKASVFKNDNLGTVTLPPSLTFIEKDAFSYCGSLTSVYISDLTAWCAMTVANGSANPLSGAENLYVNNIKVTSLLIPNDVKTINPYVFYGYDTLSSLYLPKNVTAIGASAFDSCPALTDVYYAGSQADRNNLSIDTNNQYLLNATWHYNTCNPDQHIYVSDCDIQCEKCDWVRHDTIAHTYDTTCDTDCNLCGAIRTIEHTYSANCDPDCNVCGDVRTELEHTYTNASDTECNDCGALREANYISPNVDIPVNISKPSEYADFVFIPEETGWYEFGMLNVTSVMECGIYDAETGKRTHYFNSFSDSIDAVAQLTSEKTYIVRVGLGFSGAAPFTMRIKPWKDGFYYTIHDEEVSICGYLGTVPKALDIPSEIEGYPVTTIADRAFYSVQRFTTLYIPGSVTYIGERAFAGCDRLTTVFIENGLTTIDGNGFESCSALTSVYLPTSVTSIYIYAFYACNALTDVYYSGSQQDKADIYICTTNTALNRTTWHYNYTHEHTYDYPCQANCGQCGSPRDAADHRYSNACDVTCNVCDAPRYVGGHVYAAPCDRYCNECDAWRSSDVDHSYDHDCDNYCNGCNGYRETRHVYEEVLTPPDCTTPGYITYVCTVCGDSYISNQKVEATGHTYDAACDTDCNTCGAVREAGDHVYDNNHDQDCNACGAMRDLPTDTILGDADGNSKVNNRDLGLLQQYLNGANVTIDLVAIDMDKNGRINNRDLGLLQQLLNN